VSKVVDYQTLKKIQKKQKSINVEVVIDYKFFTTRAIPNPF